MNLTVSTIGSSVQPIINKPELEKATTFIQSNASNIDKSIQEKFRAILIQLNSNFTTFISGLNETNEQYNLESKMGHCSLNILYFNQKQLAAHSDIQVIEEHVPTIIKSLEERIAAYKTEIKYREFEKNLTAQIIEGHTTHFRGFGKLRSCHGMQYRLEQAENFLAKNCPLNESEALLDFKLTEDVNDRRMLLLKIDALKEKILNIQEAYYQSSEPIPFNCHGFHSSLYEKLKRKFDNLYGADVGLNLSTYQAKLVELYRIQINLRLDEIKNQLETYSDMQKEGPMPAPFSEFNTRAIKLMNQIVMFKENVCVEFPAEALITEGNINWLRKSNWAKLDSLKGSFEAIKKDKIARDEEIIEWKEECNQTIDYFTPQINKLQKQLEMARQLNKVRESWHLSIEPKAEEPGSLLKNFTDYIFGSSTPPVETSENASHLDALTTTQAGVEQKPATTENETAK